MRFYGEPWRAERAPSPFSDNRYGQIRRNNGVLAIDGPLYRDDAVRIAAAMNNCAGLSDAALAAGVVQMLVAHYRECEWEAAVFDGHDMVAGCAVCERPRWQGHDATCGKADLLALLGGAATEGEAQP